MRKIVPLRRAAAASEDHAPQLADLFRLLGDASRLRIVITCLGTPVTVGDIAERLSLSPSLVSHHLRLLRAARVVRPTRQGRHVFYVAADEHIRRVIGDMLEHVAEPHDEEEA
jgi:DNA-binding transcriptional ArsR family regulator